MKAKELLSQTQSCVAADLARVDQLLMRLTASQAELVPIISHYIISSGGKRLRPVLTLLSARLCGVVGESHIALAAAVECIHTATLLHDDVVDESLLRRNVATANDVWGNKASVLVGDFLLSQALQIMVRNGSLHALGILSGASGVIAEGEVMQLAATHDLTLSAKNYTDIIKAKTAELFAAACQLGAVAAGKSTEEEQNLRRFGMALGIAFQIVDDALDYSAKQEELGKTVGDDFREGKVTLPVILCYENASPEEKTFWHRTMEEGRQEEGDLQEAIRLIRKHQALEAVMKEAGRYIEEAVELLETFPASEEKEALLEIAQFAVNRPY